MPSTGVTPTGFVAKTVQDLLADIEASELAIIDPALDLAPENPIGQLNGIEAEKKAELWELGGVAYNSLSRSNAEGPQLDNIGELTGSLRLPASPSILFACVTCVINGTQNYVAGELIANVSGQTAAQFTNKDPISTSGAGNHTVTGLTFIALVDGPTVANATTLTVITTPVSGWVSVNNTLDASVGSLIETDSDYRLRQEKELAAIGACTNPAMLAELLQVPGVINAFVIENDNDTFDFTYGNPPHSFRSVIWDGVGDAASNDAVAQAVWNDKPTGVMAQGAQTGNAVDDNGVTRVMPFDRAVQLDLYINAVCTLAPGVTAGSIAPLVKAAFAAYCVANITLGSEVVALAVRAAALTIPGVIDVPTFQIDTASVPTNTGNLFSNELQIYIVDTSRMTVERDMSYPTVDNNHVAEAVALLTDHYRTKINVPGLLKAYITHDQDIETMLWGVINCALLANKPTGDALTRIADLVGLKRNTADDNELFAEVILTIRTNRSAGAAVDIVDVATLAAQGDGLPTYLDVATASFIVELWNIGLALISAPQNFAYFLNRAKALGTRGVLHYSTWADGADLEFDSVSDTSVGELGWGSVSDTTAGGLMVACVGVPQ